AFNSSGLFFAPVPVKVLITHVDGSVEKRVITLTPGLGAGTNVEQRFSVCALADQTPDGGEMTLALDRDGQFTPGGNDQITLRVDPTTLPVVAFDAPNEEIRLTEGGMASDTLVLYNGVGGDTFFVQIQTEAGTATRDDFTPTPIVSELSANWPRDSFNIPAIVDDGVAEEEESFEMKLVIPPRHEGQVVLGSPARRRVFIEDNDVLELSITPNASSFQEGTQDPGMTLRARTTDPTGLVTPTWVRHGFYLNESMGLGILSTRGSWMANWSETSDENGDYTSSFVIQNGWSYAPKMGLSTESTVHEIRLLPQEGYTLAEDQGGRITITHNPNIIKAGLERPVYTVRRGAHSLRVAVLLTKRPEQTQRLRLRLRAQRPNASNSSMPDFSLDMGAFEDFSIATATVTPDSPLRVEVDIPLSALGAFDWDKDLVVMPIKDDWAQWAPQYTLSRIIVTD
ncbi:MAG: hypothetical protein MI749_00095, partial [Desulfovibrionales bacterium]|nr:hypothetical protein [Desulfovibrionales bacterium]